MPSYSFLELRFPWEHGGNTAFLVAWFGMRGGSPWQLGDSAMASIETRKTTGRVTRYRVKWRTGGARDGAWDGRAPS